MSAVKLVNPNADVIGQRHALHTNIQAASWLAALVKSNLGPKGTLKMLVGGAGQVKLTKDGKVLLDEMPVQHPTAVLVARTATAQDEITGDGTTSSVLFTAALLQQAERCLQEGMAPRHLVDGMEIAREATLKFLDEFKTEFKQPDREILTALARTSQRTKVHAKLADHLADIVVNALLCVRVPGQPLDLNMVEIMHMRHKSEMDTRFVSGLVLDHGARHPNSAKRSEKCFIFVCNVSLEYERSEINSSFSYKSAEDRERMVAAERKFTDDRVRQIIEFKRRVVGDSDKNFLVINQKGIDPISLDLLDKEKIIGIRRAKRRNMERLALACGGYAVNSLDDLKEDCLGYADVVYEHTLGDDKFTFIEGCRNPRSCTILVTGPTEHSIKQTKDALRDGLMAVANLIEDGSLVAGAGAFEVAAHRHLMNKVVPETQGREKMGVRAFADALLTIPKTLAENAGLDASETVIAVVDAAAKGVAGVDLETGRPSAPITEGIWDNYRVKKQFVHLSALIACKLLLVDEVMRAGKKLNKEE